MDVTNSQDCQAWREWHCPWLNSQPLYSCQRIILGLEILNRIYDDDDNDDDSDDDSDDDDDDDDDDDGGGGGGDDDDDDHADYDDNYDNDDDADDDKVHVITAALQWPHLGMCSMLQYTPDVMSTLTNSGMNLNPQMEGQNTIYIMIPK